MNLLGQPAHVGRHCGSHEYVASRDVVDFYADALDDPNPLYAEVAPPLLHHSECFKLLGEWYLKNLFGNLHARQDWELFRPMPVGARLRTRSTIIDRYHKRGRDYVVNETDVMDADSACLYTRGRTHQSFLPAEGKAAAGFAVDESTAAKKAERSSRPSAPEPAGELVAQTTKWIDQRRCWMFSGPGANYHTDHEKARELGFPKIVVQGMMTTCFAAEVMLSTFGEGFLRGGRMSLKLTNVVWVDEELVTRLWRGTSEPEGTRSRVHCALRVTKADGTTVLVGEASALD